MHPLAEKISELARTKNLFPGTSKIVVAVSGGIDSMVLLNLLYAPQRSRLHSLLKTLCRIENAAHICAWTKATKADALASEAQGGLKELALTLTLTLS